MHEMGIANSILEAVRTEMERRPESRATCVGVRIGELAAVDADSLQFCFDALKRDTALEALELKIEICTRRHRCKSCGNEFTVRDYDFECPRCHGFLSQCLSGDELELKYVEVEEDEPSSAGTQSSQ
jgi:hydrogenase nickel incorporation protein HypA/HybF